MFSIGIYILSGRGTEPSIHHRSIRMNVGVGVCLGQNRLIGGMVYHFDRANGIDVVKENLAALFYP